MLQTRQLSLLVKALFFHTGRENPLHEIATKPQTFSFRTFFKKSQSELPKTPLKFPPYFISIDAF